MREQLEGIFYREAQIEALAIRGTTTLEQMDVASVDMVMIVYAIEEELGVELRQEDLSRGMTFDALVSLVSTKRVAVG